MFRLFSEKEYDSAPLVREIIDATVPNKSVGQDVRQERRFNRTLPIVLAHGRPGKPKLKHSFMALTQDFSDRSLAAIVNKPLQQGTYFCSVWPKSIGFPDPIHFQCRLANCRGFAHRFWSAGFVIERIMNIDNPSAVAALDDVARRALRPPANETEAAAPELEAVMV